MKLANLNVVSFESRHAETIGSLVRVQGGLPFLAPSMKEVPLENNPEVFLFGEKIFAGKIDILILLTGVGTKALLSILEMRYPREKILEIFCKTTIVPRSPKPIRVLQEWKVPFAITVPEPNTWRELIESLDQNKEILPLLGKTVAVQEYGVTNHELTDALEKRGATVLRVPVYRWALPDDLEPLKAAIRAISDGKMEVAVFTTAVQIEHVLQVAKTMGLEQALLSAFKTMAVASVGPDCSEALRARGVSVDIEPESPKMGPLVLEIALKAKKILANKVSSPNLFIGDQTGYDSRLKLSGMTSDGESLKNSTFLKACRRQKSSFTPVWLMRQAGRYMKDYRDIREKTPFLDLCKNTDLVTEVTVHAQEKIGADAAIIFSDILLPLEPMGLNLSYVKGDGPSISNPVRGKKEVEVLKDTFELEKLSFVYQSIRQTRRALKSDVPLIGFSGAPFTLASYMIEGGATKDFSRTKTMMVSDEGLWKILMQKIVTVSVRHLNAQIEAGAQVVQIFDSWAGVLTPQEYRQYAMPYSAELIRGIRKGIPVIHFGTKTGDFLDSMRQAGGDVIGADHRISLTEAWKKIGHDRTIQGNLDPEILCGSLIEIKKHVERILKEADGRPGHIFNLGHGVLPHTPEENVIALVDMVHEMSRRE